MKPETKIIKDFLKELSIEKYIKVRASKNTETDLQKTIYFNKATYTSDFQKSIGKITYKILAEKQMDFSKINYGTFSILHEIGHLIMIKTYDDADYEHSEYSYEVETIMAEAQIEWNKNPDFWVVQENLMRKYRNLKLERDADKKAYELFLSFPQEVKALDELMMALK